MAQRFAGLHQLVGFLFVFPNRSIRRIDDAVSCYAEFATASEELNDIEAVKRACNESGYLYTITVSLHKP